MKFIGICLICKLLESATEKKYIGAQFLVGSNF